MKKQIFIWLMAIFLPVAVGAEPIALNRQFRPDPLRIEGMGGGTVSLEELAGGGRGCRGFANRQPNLTLTLGANFPMLDILAYGIDNHSDLTLLVLGDNGVVLCGNNENSGRNPQVTTRLPQGTYQIWVGSRKLNNPSRFTLSLSEIRQR